MPSKGDEEIKWISRAPRKVLIWYVNKVIQGLKNCGYLGPGPALL